MGRIGQKLTRDSYDLFQALCSTPLGRYFQKYCAYNSENFFVPTMRLMSHPSKCVIIVQMPGLYYPCQKFMRGKTVTIE
jgi:hypothetical protein